MSVREAGRPEANGHTVPFTARATPKDIFYCFRLLLGRHPHPEEWRGHAMRAGEDLQGLVTSFTGSLEYARRGMVTEMTGAPPVLTDIEGFRIYSAADDASVGGSVRNGLYEPEVCAQFRRVLRPGMGVLDLGANIGFFALLASSLVGPKGHVVAIEPNARNVRLLEASRRANGFGQLCILQVAAGRSHGLLVLNTSYSNGTTAGLPDDVAGVLAAETVPALRIDSLLPAGRRIDLIKIDVEGAEYPALLGCECAIRAHRPVIISEFSPGLMPGISGIDGPGYLGWLIGLGYELSVLRPDGGLDRAGTDSNAVMQAYAARGTDHIDIVAEPAA